MMAPDDPRHGTNAGYSAHQTDGTPPCFACKVAKANYWTHAHREMAYGRWNPWTDADPVRQHVQQLMADGMSIKRIAAAANVSPTRISYLLYGRGKREVPTKVRPDYAAAVMAVQSNPRLVPIFRVSRRLRALVALGYSQRALSERLGVSQGRVWQYTIEHQDHVTEDTFAAVDALFRQLSMKLPPRRTTNEKYSASKAMNTAKRRGYAPPLAWNDIDDPAERPRGRAMNPNRLTDLDPVAVERAMAGDRIELTKAERFEVVARLRDMGRSLRWIEDNTVITKPERYIAREAS